MNSVPLGRLYMSDLKLFYSLSFLWISILFWILELPFARDPSKFVVEFQLTPIQWSYCGIIGYLPSKIFAFRFLSYCFYSMVSCNVFFSEQFPSSIISSIVCSKILIPTNQVGYIFNCLPILQLTIFVVILSIYSIFYYLFLRPI